MRDVMVHRGPDDAGSHIDGSVGLGHRRLSIIDLATGHQPMSDDTGRVSIVYNGEIYNHVELRDELTRKGYRFRTRCDTEVILALYLTEGEAWVEKLNGIFAFAIWDARQQKLLLVRDRIGVKPLYVWRGPNLIAAASEIKALLEHPDIPREANEEAIPEYLAFRQLAGNRTVFRGIEALGPGEMMTVTRDDVAVRSYWRLPTLGGSPARREDEYLETLHELLRDAAHIRLMSDVPLGTYLSGGVDSSLVTSFAVEKTGPDLNTFCIGLGDPKFDERSYARLAAEKFSTRHRELVIGNGDFAEHLSDVIWHHDEPLTHPNTVPIYLLSRMVKQHVTVVLTGEGCDEFFGGYPRYQIGVVLQMLGRFGRTVGAAVAPSAPFGGARLRKLFNALQQGPTGAIMQAARYVSPGELAPLIEGDPEALDPARLPSHSPGGDFVSGLLEQDQRNYLPPILSRLDKATMAFSVEARVPFLDHRIIEFAGNLPSRLKVHRGANKVLVKQLALQCVPAEVVHRRKSGLALPLAHWFRSEEGMDPLLDLLLEPRAQQRSYLKGDGVRRIVERHRAGEVDQSEVLWGMLNLELWQRVMIEGSMSPPPTALRSTSGVGIAADHG